MWISFVQKDIFHSKPIAFIQIRCAMFYAFSSKMCDEFDELYTPCECV